ncbi:MAG TPA: hypothetical protein PLP66_09360 [Phycisphaerae bacterium]|nr:hypothetical protein [Phycisphaerae bacterium]
MSFAAIRLIRYDRLQTPPEHLAVLVEPPAAQLHALLAEPPAARLAAVPLLDTTLGAGRAALRAELGLSGPLILTGHQAEFFHAGVLAKTIAAHALAARLGGQAAFLTVDSDVPKTAQLALPQTTSRGLRRVDVSIPGCDPQRDFESQPRVSRADWLQFFAGVTSLHEFGQHSLLPTFARAWLTTPDAHPLYCDALARGHAAAEAALGLDGVRELRMSHLCATPAFRAFVASLLLDAHRVIEHYNAAQAAYRARHKVRARGRPVPPLVVHDEAVELPFWLGRAGEPRRRMFVHRQGARLTLRADQEVVDTLACEALARFATHAEAWPLERAGWRIRPRALALSAFARLFLGDLFIHGIGGAKYDEIMEDFVGAWLGVAAGPACCVSATLHLPLPRHGIRAADLAAARQRSRDLRYNPQRHLRAVPVELLDQRSELVRLSAERRARQPRDRAGRRVLFRELRRVNEQMLETDPWRVAEYDQRVQTLESQWRLDRIALDREYFYALHPRESLVALITALRQALAE